MVIMRPQWPHTVNDIVKALDGVWGVVGATGTTGNLLRLERSLKEPFVYVLTEYQGQDESKVVRENQYETEQRDAAVKDFALMLGFDCR